MKRNIFLAAAAGVICFIFTSCNSNDVTDITETATSDHVSIDYDVIDWRNDPDIGIVQAGYYKRVGIVKDGETYEEMLKLREIESRGCLIISDDGTAVFELDGEKTEYVYDEYKLYFAEDTARTNGASYVFIGGRLIVDDGTTVTQYLKLSDNEIEQMEND
ncbi:MAG: hypothetical protein J6X66_03780 [Lachnospiraceae bacterium]|nr:hypothetical protein [Lachnospiraceae bacterium]